MIKATIPILTKVEINIVLVLFPFEESEVAEELVGNAEVEIGGEE